MAHTGAADAVRGPVGSVRFGSAGGLNPRVILLSLRLTNMQYALHLEETQLRALTDTEPQE